MSLDEKYLDLTEDEIDNLIYGVDLVQKYESTDYCINCGSNKLIIDNTKGYKVCEDCSVINEEFLDKNQEFGGEQGGNSRYGCPSNFFYPKSALGTKITSKGYNRISALQRQGQMPYKEKSLMDVLDRIQEKCKKYVITQSIIDTAKILYKHISECKHTKGKRKGKNMIMRCINRRSMIAACVFNACKMQKEPRSPKEIADIYDLEIRHVNKGIRKFNDYIDPTTFSSIFFEIKSSEATDFIERFSKKLNIDESYIKIIKDVTNNIHKLGCAQTHEPPSIAAGCILLISNKYNLNITKKQISDIFGISDVTIAKTYRKIMNYERILTNNEMVNLIIEQTQKQQLTNSTISEEELVITDRSSDKSNINTNSDYDTISDSDSDSDIPDINDLII
jgi:transcription initiation factor TFIIB